MRISLLVLSCICCVLTSYSNTATAANLDDFIDVSGVIPGRLYVPPESQHDLRPLVLYLHGGLHAGTDNQTHINSLMDSLLDAAKERGAYLYAPQSPHDWRVGWKSSSEIATMIDYILAGTNADPHRVYVSGLSMGGGGTWDMLNHVENRFAAAMPIASDILRPDLNPANFDRLPIWAFHARDDGTAPVTNSRNLVAGILAEALEPTPEFPTRGDKDTVLEYVNEALDLRYTEYPTGGHSIWDGVWSTEAAMDWMFSQTCPSCTPNPIPALDAVTIALGGAMYSQDFDVALGTDERDLSVKLPIGWSATSNNIYNFQTVTDRFRNRARPAEGDVYNAGVKDDADRALATGVSGGGAGNELQFRAQVSSGPVTQMRLLFDLEAWSTAEKEGRTGEAAFHVLAEVDNGDGFAKVIDLGQVTTGPLEVPEGRIIIGNEAGYRANYDSGWREVDVPENSMFRLRWITDTDAETNNWVFGVDNVQLEFGRLGDIDRDGVLSVHDVDAVSATVWNPSSDGSYDITDDGIVDYNDVLTLLGIAGRLNGDADFDGEVGFDDFLKLSDHFGETDRKWSDGDFNSNGQVDFSDFLILSENYGRAIGNLATVPEPTGFGIVGFGLLALGLSPRRKRRMVH